MASPVRRPALRYHGGKWLLAPWIISHFPPHRIYVEPFGGAASVLLRKAQSYAEVYNDLHAEVVNLFRVLRDADKACRLARALHLTPFARDEFAASQNAEGDEVERARRLVLRSGMGFSSGGYEAGSTTGFRANSTRSATTPAMDWRNYPQGVAAVTERLRGVVIENRPALDVMATHDGPDTLFYLDPPYVHATRSGKRKEGYLSHRYAYEMSDAEHAGLLHAARDLAGMVVLSGYPNALYDGQLADWMRVERAAHADGARDRTEVLWLNPQAADRQRQRSLLP